MSLARCSIRRTLPVLAVLVTAVAACTGGPGATTASSAPTAASAATAATAVPTASPTTAPNRSIPVASPGGQTDTDWGRIWDALPPGFPVPPGSVPTETGAGPVTATLQLGTSVDIAADWWQEALEAAGFRIEARNGPLEDGSIVIDVAGAGSCRAQTTITPLGGVTIAKILIGAECPFS